jgi:hypothetical protein
MSGLTELEAAARKQLEIEARKDKAESAEAGVQHQPLAAKTAQVVAGARAEM